VLRIRAPLLLVVLALPPLFWRLGCAPIDRSMEGREALVVQEMVRSGNWVLPRPNGEDVPHKPPLMHWVAATAATARGGVVDETSVRLPSALASLASLLLLFALVARERGEAAGLLAALVLLTTECFTRQGRAGWVDPVLAACVLGAVVAFRTCERSGRVAGGPAAALYVALGLGILAKGPIGLVLPGLGLGLYLALTRQGALARALARPRGVAITAAVAVPWYVAAFALGGWLFFRTHVLTENLVRLVHGPEGHRPIYFFVLVLFPQGAPWSFLFPLALVAAWRARRRPTLETLALAWFLADFVFLSLASGKRPVYLLPLMPAVAIVVGAWITTLPAWRPRPAGPARAAAALAALVALATLVGVAGAVAGWWPGEALLASLGRDVRLRTLAPLAGAMRGHAAVTVASLVVIALAAGGIVLALGRGRPPHVGAAVLCLLWAYIAVPKPLRWEQYQEPRSLKRFAQAGRQLVGDAPLWYFRTGALPHAFFYFDRHVPHAPCEVRPPRLTGCPPGYYLLPARVWKAMRTRDRAGARPLLESPRAAEWGRGGQGRLLLVRLTPEQHVAPGRERL
jgi:4-amino-4-deoxy-L-arabinose transferase-like glycosyltransferase